MTRSSHLGEGQTRTTGGTSHDLQLKQNHHDDFFNISPRRHSTMASDHGYYCNKSNSSVGSAASGTPSSSPTGSKVVAGGGESRQMLPICYLVQVLDSQIC